MKNLIIIIVLFINGQAFSQTTKNNTIMDNQEQYTFQLSEKVNRQEVTFKNRYGITVAGDLYTPKIIKSI